VAFPADADRDLIPVLRIVRTLPADVLVVPRLHEIATTVSRSALDDIWGIPVLPLRRHTRVSLAAKYVLDALISLALLAVLVVPLAILGLVVRCQLRRPALFRQMRVTGQGRQAEIIKLRTVGGHTDPDTCWVAPVRQSTRFGRFLRVTHLDELPQLVNVICGQMSLVGPRPERPYFDRRFSDEIPGYADRRRMKAGLTGWAQVHGLNGDTSIADRAAFDNAYIEYWSPWMDLVILARTVCLAVMAAAGRRRVAGVSQPATGTSSEATFHTGSQGGQQ